ncbi:hypothetical protein AAVH_32608 [Aphelenchoides avenae]|nr:hypothetical protein AAVH_32608 [Aphelenchus avenae]
MFASNASKSYAEAAKSPPSTLKTPKKATQGVSSNNGGRSAVPAQLIPPPNTASHYPPVDSRVEKSAKNQFAAGGNQHPGARRSGSQQTGSQYEPGTKPPPNKRPTYSARVFTANRKANDARDNSAMAQKTTGAGQSDSANGSVQLLDTRRTAVNEAKAKNTGRGSTTKAVTVEAEAKMRAAAAEAAA